MNESYNRRNFIKIAASAGIGMSIMGSPSLLGQSLSPKGKRIGIIGLDTSHSVAFTKEFNDPDADTALGGYRVIAAYPKGSNDIESSYKRIPGYTEKVKEMGVQIVGSIKDLLKRVDVVLLETNDGRLHLEQALPVMKAGKRMFIDKPITASLCDAIIIFDIAEHYKVPVFSSSALRFMENVQAVAKGKTGKVLGAFAYSPAIIEKTHPDFFWYGIHGVETLFTVMGTGCKRVVRIHTEGTDTAVGVWNDGRIGTFRGTRTGKHDYGGIAFGENGNTPLGPFRGYKPLLLEIVKFFRTGEVPVSSKETLEILTFMEAADESKRRGGTSVNLDIIWERAREEARKKQGSMS